MEQLSLFPLGTGKRVVFMTTVQGTKEDYRIYHYRDINGNYGYKTEVIKK